ncbi:unnamed protein product [Closterium sp. NIES-64]|nr:unnamed protein product [Closterium sp. NIES-64]
MLPLLVSPLARAESALLRRPAPPPATGAPAADQDVIWELHGDRWRRLIGGDSSSSSSASSNRGKGQLRVEVELEGEEAANAYEEEHGRVVKGIVTSTGNGNGKAAGGRVLAGEEDERSRGGDMVARVVRGVKAAVVRWMLPEGYPDSVTPDYMEYTVWRMRQTVASEMNHVLTTQAMLYAVGLGKGAIPAAAAVNWVLKDGLGYAAKVTLSQFGRHFDVSPKRSRLLSDLVENLSASLELLTATFPQYFVQLAAAAGAGFSASSLVQSATRNRFYAGLAGRRNFAENLSASLELLTATFPQYFVQLAAAAGAGFSASSLVQSATRNRFYAGLAGRRNFAEVLARAEAQGMVSKTLGMALGIAIAPHCLGAGRAQGMVSKTLGMALGIAIAPHVGTRGHLLWLIHACPAVRPTHVIVLHFLLLPFLSPQVLARAEAQGMVSKTLGMALGIAIAPHVARGVLYSGQHPPCCPNPTICVFSLTVPPLPLPSGASTRRGTGHDIVLAEYVTNGRVPGVIEASPPPLPGTGSENWIEFGVPLASRQQWLTQTDVSTLPYSHSTRTPSPPPLSRPLPLLVQAQAVRTGSSSECPWQQWRKRDLSTPSFPPSPPVPLPRPFSASPFPGVSSTPSGTGSENWIEFGVPLAAVAHTEREAETMADIFRGEKYLLGGTSVRADAGACAAAHACVVLKEGALPRDFLRAALQAAYLRTLSPHVLCPTIHSLAPQARTHVQARAAEFSSLGKQIKVLHALLFPSHLFLLLSSPCLLTPATTIHAGSVEGGGTPKGFPQSGPASRLPPHPLSTRPLPHHPLSRTPSAHPRPSPRSRIRFLGKLEVLHASYDRMAAGFDGLCEALRANGWRCDDGLLARPGDWRLLLAPEEKRK